MPERNKILESWIMVEHLSEGDINIKDKNLLGFEDLEGEDYYSFFQKKMNERSFTKYKKRGIAVFLDLFEFKQVIVFLRKMYHLPTPEEEGKYGSKFRLALYFDKDLLFLQDMTFFTVSGYIHCFKKLPKAEEFRKYEDELKVELTQIFEKTIETQLKEDAEDPSDEKSETSFEKQTDEQLRFKTDKVSSYGRRVKREKFNEAFKKVLCLQGDGIEISACRMQLINNTESDAANLHSFFMEDLDKAKTIRTENLDKYLLGTAVGHINLDSKKESENFNPDCLKRIMQPLNYPLGRFPSKTEFGLSFMQQIAVNLSAGYDNNQMRSVNGPPGTGKTTLLKDIFADLIVKQAYDICNLPDKLIKGTDETRYFDKASIGVIPEHIAENGIVVASSNNGAVQNIVNELPLIGGIDKALIDELTEADYFMEISNSNVSQEWKDGKQVIQIEPKEEKKFWGLFSLEGGKSDNVAGILANLSGVVNYLKTDYEEDEDVYDEFMKKYQETDVLRSKAQNFAEEYDILFKDKKAYEHALDVYTTEKESREQVFQRECTQINAAIGQQQEEIDKLDQNLRNLQQNAVMNEQNRINIQQYLQSLEGNKPGLFAKKQIKDQYRNNISEAQTNLMQLLKNDMEYTRQIQLVQQQLANLQEMMSKEKVSLQNKQQELHMWQEKSERDISDLRERITSAEQKLLNGGIKPLDLDIPYDELQLSNPWFDEQFRIAQSKMFIAALRVRKQFLYENLKNINAATNIWRKQKEHLDNKIVIEAAWKWINMTIPVISSTFASFGRMFKNLGKNTLGHLFIDEAGQALPQAGVGAIFRSKHVMVVGDPAQIKPVLTLDPYVLGVLGKHFEVSGKYLSESASVQTMVDAVSQYGYYRDKDKSESSWIGIPLWVHRRCQYPMFSISNLISYNNLMVQGKPGYGKTGWYDIKGKAKDKYVEEQGEFLLRIIQEMAELNPAILDKNKDDVIYVISPFSNVAYQLSEKLKSIGFTRYDRGKPTNIGTIHTFQGKEAPIVFMVLGADKQSSGAARWAVDEPNMMNVAATRAQNEFYIIGDRELYLGVGSSVATDTYGVIKKYKNEHPDLVFETEKAYAGNSQ